MGPTVPDKTFTSKSGQIRRSQREGKRGEWVFVVTAGRVRGRKEVECERGGEQRGEVGRQELEVE